jgi:hypothetical protein
MATCTLSNAGNDKQQLTSPELLLKVHGYTFDNVCSVNHSTEKLSDVMGGGNMLTVQSCQVHQQLLIMVHGQSVDHKQF